MKTTVLNASKTMAANICKDLLTVRNSRNKPLFWRHEVENGFEIKGRKKDGTIIVVFRFINDSGRMKFDYDERVITFSSQGE